MKRSNAVVSATLGYHKHDGTSELPIDDVTRPIQQTLAHTEVVPALPTSRRSSLGRPAQRRLPTVLHTCHGIDMESVGNLWRVWVDPMGPVSA
jgi:hypothetical protein